MKRILSFADSCDVTDRYQDGYSVFPLGRFFDMWREGPCAQKEVPYEQPFAAAWRQDVRSNDTRLSFAGEVTGYGSDNLLAPVTGAKEDDIPHANP